MNKFFTDHHFLIGERHLRQGKPCQDYALSGVYGDSAFAVVSDGCSTGKNTDIGSRIITLSVGEAIRDYSIQSKTVVDESVVKKINTSQQFMLGSSRQMLGLDREDLLATCFYAYATSKGALCHIRGDGVVAWKSRGNALSMVKIDWDKNMPFYPIYEEDNCYSFIQAHGGIMSALILKKESEAGIKNLTLEEGIKGITICFSEKDMEDLEFISVFSDGIAQIENVDWKDVVQELLAFKSIPGEFAKRRMIKFAKDLGSRNCRFMDDLSYAVILSIANEKEGEHDRV